MQATVNVEAARTLARLRATRSLTSPAPISTTDGLSASFVESAGMHPPGSGATTATRRSLMALGRNAPARRAAGDPRTARAEEIERLIGLESGADDTS
jgi:hypothetical protein